MGLLSRLRGRSNDRIAFDMFDLTANMAEREARRARRLESIYHVGQERIWDGRAVLADLIAQHGRPQLPERERKALSRIFSIIMWGELAAWKISAQLTDQLVELEPKLAAASQVHDEARHFYVMHDYLTALGHQPPPMDFWSRRVVEMTLHTKDLTKKLLGMQLTIETIALTLFQHVRELRVEPVLADLLPYYERDEARHVGLGTQLVPALMAKLSIPEKVGVALFQLELLASSVFSLKAMEPDLMAIGVDPREILAIGFRKQMEIHATMSEDFPGWPEDPPVNRLFHGLCEVLFPSEGHGVRVAPHQRVLHGLAVVARAREGVLEIAERARVEARAKVTARAGAATGVAEAE
ncbi:MAG TPA: ferritin-like domain-containing protein [Labilithrix sp.]|nr:ferritin-like domain-containing protein [Labilithrix sp.]